MSKKILRIGFDLDGVILYNPARVVRPLISIFKRTILHKRKLTFYYPRHPLQKWMWRQFHRSSIFIAPGMDDVKRLVREGKIEAYLVTARFSFLGPELEKWIRQKKLDSVFSQVYYNKDDEQPHLYKEKMIDKLDLDAFIDDNYDIVEYLTRKYAHAPKKIYWIYNMFDVSLQHRYKFPSLKKAVQSLI